MSSYNVQFDLNEQQKYPWFSPTMKFVEASSYREKLHALSLTFEHHTNNHEDSAENRQSLQPSRLRGTGYWNKSFFIGKHIYLRI